MRCWWVSTPSLTLRPALPGRVLDQPGQTVRRHTPGSGLSDRPADGAGGLRGDLRRVGAGCRARAGRGAGQTRSVHVAGHSEPARIGAEATRHGGRPAIHGHGDGAPGRGPGGAGADRRDHRRAAEANHSPSARSGGAGLAEFGDRCAGRDKRKVPSEERPCKSWETGPSRAAS